MSDSGNEMSRRKVLGLGIVAAAATLVPSKLFAAVEAYPEDKWICLYNVHTHEYLDTLFWKNGSYLPEALNKISHLFRDTRNGKVKSINKDLIARLHSLQMKLKNKEPIQIISGYRSPRSNAMLRKQNKRVAKNSFHMYGKAADIRVPGISTKGVRRAAMDLRIGGVGYYPRSKFVHIDVGEVRFWRG